MDGNEYQHKLNNAFLPCQVLSPDTTTLIAILPA